MGCTEPIALAYAAARAREVLGALPESVQLQVSGSIIKNVKSVIVPNTGHLKGMEAAVAAGIIAGSADKELEVISEVSEDKKAAIRDYLQTVPISIQHIEQGHVFDIIVTERSGDSLRKGAHCGFSHQHLPDRKEWPGVLRKAAAERGGPAGQPGRPQPAEHEGHLGLCRDGRPAGCGGPAGTPDPLQQRHCRGGPSGRLWREYRPGAAFYLTATMCLSGPRPRRPPGPTPA